MIYLSYIDCYIYAHKFKKQFENYQIIPKVQNFKQIPQPIVDWQQNSIFVAYTKKKVINQDCIKISAMDKALIGQNVDKFMKELKTVQNREEFIGKMKEYENQFYGHYEKTVQDNLLDELKKKQFQPDQQENLGFLRNPTQAEKDYMQGQFRYNKFSRQKDEEQSQNLRQAFQQSQEGQFTTYVPPKYNYIDVQANSKQYYPDQDVFIKDMNRPQQSFSNAQNIFLNRNIPSNQQGQETKNVYPRKLFGPHDHEVSHPYFLAQEAPALALKSNIQKLGGIQDTLSIMEPSLREHEKKAFYERNKFDLFQHNTGINDPHYQPFPQAAVISNVQNRPQTTPPATVLPQNPHLQGYNPFDRNPYQAAQLLNLSPIRNIQSDNYPSSPFNRQNNYGQQRPPTGMQGQYDKFLNYNQVQGNTNKFGNTGDYRNQFETGPVFINGAHNI